MTEDREVVHRHDERRARGDRSAERRAVQHVEPGRGASEPERVPEPVPSERGEPPGAARLEPHQLDAGSSGESPE